MKQWAHQVEQLQLHCSVCQGIAQRIRDEPLLYGEKAHLAHATSAALNTFRRQIRDGVNARYAQRRFKRDE